MCGRRTEDDCPEAERIGATIKKIDRKALGENLLAVARKTTAHAESEYGENVVVVDRTTPPDKPAGELFKA